MRKKRFCLVLFVKKENRALFPKHSREHIFQRTLFQHQPGQPNIHQNTYEVHHKEHTIANTPQPISNIF